MINQILVNDEWVDGNPSVDGQLYRKKIPVGSLFGYETLNYSTTLPAIRTISTQAFIRRMLQSERVALRNSANEDIIDIREDLKLKNTVNLDGLIANQLDTIGLSQARKDILLADGTLGEIS